MEKNKEKLPFPIAVIRMVTIILCIATMLAFFIMILF
jgi:hypothetical protein